SPFSCLRLVSDVQVQLLLFVANIKGPALFSHGNVARGKETLQGSTLKPPSPGLELGDDVKEDLYDITEQVRKYL
ncbi:hypothetical protein AVEN_94152-1, partial [Araneus ventricosus]